jgi:hypothetical protein
MKKGSFGHLKLHRETLRGLSAKEAAAVAGGTLDQTCVAPFTKMYSGCATCGTCWNSCFC